MPDENDQATATRKSGLVYAAVTSLVVAIIALLAAGWALDRWLGTTPWMLVGGIVIGSAVGFYQFIRIISKIS
jgi:ATP synthase protein I